MAAAQTSGSHRFLLAMAAAVALAWIAPDPGARGGVLHAHELNKVAVALIFFLHGLSLSFQALRHGVMRWPVHLVVQLACFGLFPLFGLLFMAIGHERLPADLNTGMFYLCALPSTLSSSVALTAAARGNVAVALFNATLSSLLGVLVTPLWLHAALGAVGRALPIGPVMWQLTQWLLLPLALGQLARGALAAWAARHRRLVGFLDRGTIILLVYTSFCDSVKAGVWTSASGKEHGTFAQSSAPVLLTALACLLLLVVMLATLSGISRALRLPRGDGIAAIFCGSKKTLASGVPMAQLMFGSHPGLGMILMPLMIYHPLQLALCGLLAGRWAQQHAQPDGTNSAARD